MTISKLCTYSNITNNHSGPRTQKICKITPHYMADGGAFSGKGCADYFHQMGLTGTRQSSSNYCIGGSGDVACSVPEEYRSWCSSSDWNDQRAITIEVSCINNTTGEITKAAWNALVDLCVDICKRYGFTLTYDGTPNGSLTTHKMYAATVCPGPYLEARMPELARTVNAKLNTSNTGVSNNVKKIYWNYDAVLKIGDIVSSRSMAIKRDLANSMVHCDDLGCCFPMKYVSEANDTKDGKQDNVLNSDLARVWLDECKVEDVDTKNNKVKLHGIWVKADPLCRKEYR